MSVAKCRFQNVPPIWPILQKGHTTVGWTFWRHRNANNKVCPPQNFSANSVSDCDRRLPTYSVGAEPFNARASHYSATHVFGYNSPAAAAREVFKPSTDSASLVVPSKKNFSVLG